MYKLDAQPLDEGWFFAAVKIRKSEVCISRVRHTTIFILWICCVMVTVLCRKLVNASWKQVLYPLSACWTYHSFSVVPLAIHFQGSYQTSSADLEVSGTRCPQYFALTSFPLLVLVLLLVNVIPLLWYWHWDQTLGGKLNVWNKMVWHILRMNEERIRKGRLRNSKKQNSNKCLRAECRKE
jgi:hypothetical protein